ncbi:MAG: 16S rRNA (guanine(527)-N(7))-methyltransferase RsmG [Alphaproteobacteria bacterium]|nr:16S rRNA (guanine(527)-N(7))-methyltransferase RsmG [Alphaproteobacteria bacterium]
MKKFEEKYNVSHETFLDLKCYLSLLEEWQNKFNLVSNSSLETAWERHFLDSAQLFKYIPETAKALVDFGSGAGFPGMVLAIMGKNRTPYLKVTLIESIKKKTVYLNEVARQTNTEVEILNERIENIKNRKFDVITSRAMTSLTNLLNYTGVFCKKETICIFPKGKNYEAELEEAKKHWKFDCRVEPSEFSEEGKILIINNIVRRK